MGCTGVILPGLFALSFTYSIGPGSMARERSGQFLAYIVSRESIYVPRTESRFQQQRYRTPASWDSIFRILNQVVPITQFAQPGGWNDLDLLYVGSNLLTAAEQQDTCTLTLDLLLRLMCFVVRLLVSGGKAL